MHCKAGLGRTGLLLCSYMMKHFGFTAHEAIGYIRICRPGSVIGCQQQWLEAHEAAMHQAGRLMRKQLGHQVGRMLYWSSADVLEAAGAPLICCSLWASRAPGSIQPEMQIKMHCMLFKLKYLPYLILLEFVHVTQDDRQGLSSSRQYFAKQRLAQQLSDT